MFWLLFETIGEGNLFKCLLSVWNIGLISDQLIIEHRGFSSYFFSDEEIENGYIPENSDILKIALMTNCVHSGANKKSSVLMVDFVSDSSVSESLSQWYN